MPTRAARSCLAVALSVVLAGCIVGPNYEKPKLPTPPAYRFAEATAQAQSLADAPWFQVFDDQALQALISDAIANNLDLRVAVAHVDGLDVHGAGTRRGRLGGGLLEDPQPAAPEVDVGAVLYEVAGDTAALS